MSDTVGNHRILSVRWLAILSSLSSLEKVLKEVTTKDIEGYLEKAELPYSFSTISTALTQMKQAGLVTGTKRARTPGQQGVRSTFNLTEKGRDAAEYSFNIVVLLKSIYRT